MELSVIFPVHNEAGTIEKTILRAIATLREKKISYEIICVENGSTDRTPETLARLAKKYPSVRVVVSDQGWGNAVRRGIKAAKGGIICYMVSDYQVDPQYIGTVYDELKRHPGTLVKVSRITRENRQRLINSRLYNLLAKLLFGFATFDINATPKIVAADRIRTYHFISHNIAFDLELLMKMKRDRVRVLDIPVRSLKRTTGTSTTNWKSVMEMVRYMIRFRWGIK